MQDPTTLALEVWLESDGDERARQALQYEIVMTQSTQMLDCVLARIAAHFESRACPAPALNVVHQLLFQGAHVQPHVQNIAFRSAPYHYVPACKVLALSLRDLSHEQYTRDVLPLIRVGLEAPSKRACAVQLLRRACALLEKWLGDELSLCSCSAKSRADDAFANAFLALVQDQISRMSKTSQWSFINECVMLLDRRMRSVDWCRDMYQLLLAHPNARLGDEQKKVLARAAHAHNSLIPCVFEEYEFVIYFIDRSY